MKLKNSLVLGIAVMASHGAQAEIQPQAVDMGAFKFVPTLTVSHSYDDNIFNQSSDTKGSSITRLQPQLQLIAESGANTYAELEVRMPICHHQNAVIDFQETTDDVLLVHVKRVFLSLPLVACTVLRPNRFFLRFCHIRNLNLSSR